MRTEREETGTPRQSVRIDSPVEETGFFGTAEDAGVLAGLDVWIALTFPSRKIRKRRHEAVFETSIASRDRRAVSAFAQKRRPNFTGR
jgi:hypothetical protein